ncbi:thioredoxin-like protein [Pavlovales sp. CCMP2436]|nr:thioredoxin-like protein [Pavlovales sp. CCMP2436]
MTPNIPLVLGTGAAAAAIFAVGYYRGRLTAPGMRVGGSAFASINKPTAGARFEQKLLRGPQKLQLYSLGTPNGQKVTCLLEELGVPYDATFINIGSGDQFGSGFVALNPNSKIPALLDLDAPGGGEQRIFESGAILMYLAEKYHSDLLPSEPKRRAECLSWLFMNVGAAPYFGNFGHFSVYAPGAKTGDVMPYARDRFKIETQRLCAVLEMQLSDGRPYLLDTQLTIADLAWLPWIICLDKFYKARQAREY